MPSNASSGAELLAKAKGVWVHDSNIVARSIQYMYGSMEPAETQENAD